MITREEKVNWLNNKVNELKDINPKESMIAHQILMELVNAPPPNALRLG